MVLHICVLLCLFGFTANGDIITNMDYAPSLESTDTVQFFLLETAFAYNVPEEFR